MLFSLLLFLLLLDESEHQIYFDTTHSFIPHIPAFLGDQPTNRSFHDYRYLFLACVSLRTFRCGFLCCMTARADKVQQCCWTAKHVPAVEEGLGLRTWWVGAEEAMRTAVLDERPMEAVTARRLVPAFRLSQIKLEGKGPHHHQHQ